jgi:hypothetical protein
VNLVVRDDFFERRRGVQPGRPRSLAIRAPGGEPARRVEVRKQPGEPPPDQECVSFTNRPNKTGSNLRTEQGVMFERALASAGRS